ncbi:MAG: RNA polymerase sigma factor [bacterium]|nr:RNA polymerase sigma factor [bacterium]
MKVNEQEPGSVSREAITDEQLALQAGDGLQSAFEELASRYTTRLFRFLSRRMASEQDAEDLTQETLIRAFQNIRSYDSRWRFSTWLYTIASRLAINYNRSKSRKAGALSLGDAPLSDSALSVPETPLTTLSRNEDSENLWMMARQLKAGQYEALWLRYVEELKVEEIAGVMKKTRIHVRVLLHRARSNLSNLLRQFPVGNTGNSDVGDGVPVPQSTTGNPGGSIVLIAREEPKDVLFSS